MKKYFSSLSFVSSFIACAVLEWTMVPILFLIIFSLSFINKKFREKDQLAKSLYLLGILLSLVLGCLLVHLVNWMSATQGL